MAQFQMIWSAYHEGFAAWDVYIETDELQMNPYDEGTPEFYSWNRGWNCNDNGMKNEPIY